MGIVGVNERVNQMDLLPTIPRSEWFIVVLIVFARYWQVFNTWAGGVDRRFSSLPFAVYATTIRARITAALYAGLAVSAYVALVITPVLISSLSAYLIGELDFAKHIPAFLSSSFDYLGNKEAGSDYALVLSVLFLVTVLLPNTLIELRARQFFQLRAGVPYNAGFVAHMLQDSLLRDAPFSGFKPDAKLVMEMVAGIGSANLTVDDFYATGSATHKTIILRVGYLLSAANLSLATQRVFARNFWLLHDEYTEVRDRYAFLVGVMSISQGQPENQAISLLKSEANDLLQRTCLLVALTITSALSPAKTNIVLKAFGLGLPRIEKVSFFRGIFSFRKRRLSRALFPGEGQKAQRSIYMVSLFSFLMFFVTGVWFYFQGAELSGSIDKSAGPGAVSTSVQETTPALEAMPDEEVTPALEAMPEEEAMPTEHVDINRSSTLVFDLGAIATFLSLLVAITTLLTTFIHEKRSARKELRDNKMFLLSTEKMALEIEQIRQKLSKG